MVTQCRIKLKNKLLHKPISLDSVNFNLISESVFLSSNSFPSIKRIECIHFNATSKEGKKKHYGATEFITVRHSISHSYSTLGIYFKPSNYSRMFRTVQINAACKETLLLLPPNPQLFGLDIPLG